VSVKSTDLANVLHAAVSKIRDQRYLFGIVLILAPTAVLLRVGERGAVKTLVPFGALEVVVVVIVRLMPMPRGDEALPPSPARSSDEQRAQILGNLKVDTAGIQMLLSRRECILVYKAVEEAVETAAETLRINREKVRGTIHARIADNTCMLADFCVGQFFPIEHTVTMRVGEGAAGTALQGGGKKGGLVYYPRAIRPSSLKLRGKEEGKLHPGLTWIVSAPIPITLEDGTSLIVWTLNIDGVDDRRSKQDLENLSVCLTGFSSTICGTLNGVVHKERS
jgi:hypothetical protein